MKKALLALAFVFTASAALAGTPTRGAAPGSFPFHPNDPDGDGVWDYNDGEGNGYRAGQLRLPVSAYEGVATDGNYHPNDADGDGVWDYNDGEGNGYRAGQLRNPPAAFEGVTPTICARIPGKDVALRSRIDWVRINGEWTTVTVEFCDYTDHVNGN